MKTLKCGQSLVLYHLPVRVFALVVLILGLISMYEKRLKQINPGVRNIQYNVKDFNNYLDHMGDACALVYFFETKFRFDSNTLSYQPHDREWLKSKVLQSFMKMAQGK